MKNSIFDLLAINTKILREKRGLSQDDLSKLTGLHKSYISDIERGKRNISLQNIEKIASALQIEPYKLFIGGNANMNIKNEIKQIIKDEFTKLVINIENDFKINYKKKTHNFLLSELDPEMTAHMVFVSSFESKSGNAIQECARRIASLKFGEKNVPLLVNPHGLPTNDIQVTGREQVIISNIKFEDEVVQSEIQKFITHHMASGKGKKRKESTTNQETIKELLQLSKIKSNTIQTKPADLVFFDGDNWNIVEIKAGGDLDSSNAPGNVKKMLTLYVALNVPNAKLYFATIYHKTGEGTTWTGAVKQYLSYPDMFLIGSKFWEKILPEGIKFTDFCKIYGDAMKEIDLNKRLKTMIKDCLK